MNILQESDTILFVLFDGLNSDIKMNSFLFIYRTRTPAIRDAVVIEIAGTNGVPKASVSFFRSGITGVKPVTMLSIRISIAVGRRRIVSRVIVRSRPSRRISSISRPHIAAFIRQKFGYDGSYGRTGDRYLSWRWQIWHN